MGKREVLVPNSPTQLLSGRLQFQHQAAIPGASCAPSVGWHSSGLQVAAWMGTSTAPAAGWRSSSFQSCCHAAGAMGSCWGCSPQQRGATDLPQNQRGPSAEMLLSFGSDSACFSGGRTPAPTSFWLTGAVLEYLWSWEV